MPEPSSDRPRLVIAFDFGRRRIGVACGDTLSRTATPVACVSADASGPSWEKIDGVLRDWQPTLLVVGLPYNLDDSENGMTRAARAFAAQLTARHGLPVQLVDERYSSQEAGSRLAHERETGRRKRRVGKADVDAAAACVILERWFSETT